MPTAEAVRQSESKRKRCGLLYQTVSVKIYGKNAESCGSLYAPVGCATAPWFSVEV